MALNTSKDKTIENKKQCHILNGDALKNQFPQKLNGDKIIVRECLIEGTFAGENLKAFYQNRAKYLSATYAENEEQYYESSVLEFDKIQKVEEQVEINLWFEDDLFCQTNFWFVASLLHRKLEKNAVFLVRPDSHNIYGFGSLSSDELIGIFKRKTHLNNLSKIAALWGFYKENNLNNLVDLATDLKNKFPFILKAVNAHKDRFPNKNNKICRPKQTLVEIINEFKTNEFAVIFNEFSKRASIYGFGDLQVKKMLDELETEL